MYHLVRASHLSRGNSYSQFIFQPMKHTPYTGKSELNSTMAVTAVGVAISSYYADGLLESCKDVQFPSNNQKVGDCVKVLQLNCVAVANTSNVTLYVDVLKAVQFDFSFGYCVLVVRTMVE